MFADSAWTWSEVRKQYYYHEFAVQQIDVNYRDPHAQKEMQVRYFLILSLFFKKKRIIVLK